ncbi:MAG: acyltransferase [Sphingobium sp.]|nr:acyltransferase [Sphingobium sp.]
MTNNIEQFSSTQKKMIYSLQILRGLAALMVLVRHSSKIAFEGSGIAQFPMGQSGVDIFFVISGIVIFITGRHLDWYVFARRRIARIVPLYWLMTTISVSVAILSVYFSMGGYKSHGGFSVVNAIASYLFIPSFDENGGIYPAIVLGWTLNFEMYFYMICTLVLLLAPKRWFLQITSVIIVIGIALGSALYWIPGNKIELPLAIWLLPITAEFVAGLWLARLWVQGFRTPLWLNAILIIAAVAALIISPISGPYSILRPLYWGIPAIMIVWAALSSEEAIDFSRWRVGQLIGDASYAIYLTHPLVLNLAGIILRKLKLDIPIWAELAALVAGCTITGIFVHKFIELPMVAHVSKWLGLSKRKEAVPKLAPTS